MDKNPKTGRFVNVEIYSSAEFNNLLYDGIQDALIKLSFWDFIRSRIDATIKKAIRYVFDEFEKRLEENKN